MTGIDAATGRALGGIAHLRQSVADILSTPLGTRVLLRSYGSRVGELLDRPSSPGLLIDIQAETAAALARWEPRLRLRRVRARLVAAGRVAVDLDGTSRESGEALQLTVEVAP